MSIPFPSPVTTDRLLIRTPRPEDAQALNGAALETWDQLKQWMPWATSLPSLEDSRDTCCRMATNTQEGRDYALFCFDRATGEFVLATGTHPRNPNVPSYEIGYWCRASYQGKGYVTEAVQALTQTCFEVMGARRIEIRCDARNEPSRAVAERCGYRLEGTFTNDCRDTAGLLRSTLIFAQTRNDP